MIDSSLLSPSLISALAHQGTAPDGNKRVVDEVATEFESVFLSQMLSHMFSGEMVSSFFGSGSSGEIYKGYMLDEFGKAMAKAGGIGIADYIKTELLKLQEIV